MSNESWYVKLFVIIAICVRSAALQAQESTPPTLQQLISEARPLVKAFLPTKAREEQSLLSLPCNIVSLYQRREALENDALILTEYEMSLIGTQIYQLLVENDNRQTDCVERFWKLHLPSGCASLLQLLLNRMHDTIPTGLTSPAVAAIPVATAAALECGIQCHSYGSEYGSGHLEAVLELLKAEEFKRAIYRYYEERARIEHVLQANTEQPPHTQPMS